MTMQVAILAGGLARRLGLLTENKPKSMVLVQGRPFLAYQLELLKRNGIANIVLCIGHLGDQIKSHFTDGRDFGVNISYSPEDKPLGTAGALRNAEGLLEDEFFTLYGDSYLHLDFGAAMSYFKGKNKPALMSVYKNSDRYGKSNTLVEGDLVRKFSKKDRTADMVYIEYGANIFQRRVLEMIPQNEPYSLDELFPRLIEQGELLAYEVKERFYEIGSPRGLREFERYILSEEASQ